MDISQISDAEVLVRLGKLVKSERKITHIILTYIHEVDSRRLYASAGYSSMIKFLVKEHGYAEDSAYRRWQASRVLASNPEVSVALEDGKLNLTQLTQVQKCIREEIKSNGDIDSQFTSQVLEQIQGKNAFDTQKVLAVEFNQPIKMHEVVKPQRDDSVRVEMSLSDEQMKTIAQVKDLLSHVLPDGNLADLFFHLAAKEKKRILGKEVLVDSEKNAQVQLVQSVVESDEKIMNAVQSDYAKVECLDRSSVVETTSFENAENTTQRFLGARKRQHINVTTKRDLLAKAGHCCEYVDGGTQRKCASTYQLQVDHIVPLAKGGKDDQSNMRVLCRTHNLFAARQWNLVQPV